MKKIIRLTEHDLFKIVKRVINEDNGDNDDFKVYSIPPYMAGASTLYVAVKDGKIYTYNRFKNKMGEQIGGWGTPRQAYQALKMDNPIIQMGEKYVLAVNGLEIPTLLYFGQRPNLSDFAGYAFILEAESNIPQLIGFDKKGEVLYGSKGYPMEVTTIETTPPPPPPPVEPEIITLDLKNLFHYDCPTPQNPGNETFTCGRTSKSDNTPTGGSDAQPFRDQRAAEMLINKFGKALLSVRNFSTIRDKTFYVIGFASTEGTPQHNFMLSLSRAEYVADMLNEITGGKIRFVGVGKGATTVFGTDLPSNRRVIVTTDENSTTPVIIKIRKDGDGNVTNVSLLQKPGSK